MFVRRRRRTENKKIPGNGGDVVVLFQLESRCSECCGKAGLALMRHTACHNPAVYLILIHSAQPVLLLCNECK
ncbi:hypothetical protein HHUSO_G35654 [Huso huso]|uniref:Uncharacterized protein n=1 Tax=Huso huso TaxID=61971 RepID=A0ABR0Y3D4_HUSHU